MLKQWTKPVPTTYKQGTKNLALNERGEKYTLFLEHEGYDYDTARGLFQVLVLVLKTASFSSDPGTWAGSGTYSSSN